jgi:hypothetical protein
MAETGDHKEKEKPLTKLSSAEKTSGDRKQKVKKSPKSKPRNGNKESKEKRETKAKLESKIRDRVASEARAFDIVNRLIEAAVSPDYLQQAVSGSGLSRLLWL